MRKINTVYHLYVESKKYSKLINKIKKKHTHSYREQTSGYLWGEVTQEGQYRGRQGKGVIPGLYKNHVCKTSENCKASQNLNNLLPNKK